MRKDLIEYYYKSALVLLRDGKFMGEQVDILNEKEVIAVLYAMYLMHDQLYKEKERESITDGF